MIRSVVSSMLSDSDIRERLGPIDDPSLDPQGPSQRRRPAVSIAALVVLLLLLWGGGVALLWHLERISPRVPDPSSGHVYRFTDTRHTVYFTQKEQYAAWGAIGVPIVATLAAAFLWFWRATADRPG